MTMNSFFHSYRAFRVVAKITVAFVCTVSVVTPALANSSIYQFRNDSDCPADPFDIYRICNGVSQFIEPGRIGAHSAYAYVMPQCANGFTPGIRLHFLSGVYSNADFDMGPSPAP